MPTPRLSPLRHPTERRDGPGRFEAMAEAVSNLAGSSFFFIVCLLLVIGWIVGLFANLPQSTDNDIVGAMTALTLVLVAVLKNSERRAERAMQLKLDAIAAALLEERGERLAAETKTELEEAVRLHEEI